MLYLQKTQAQQPPIAASGAAGQEGVLAGRPALFGLRCSNSHSHPPLAHIVSDDRFHLRFRDLHLDKMYQDKMYELNLAMEGPLNNQVGYPITVLYCACLHSFNTRVEALPAKILAPDGPTSALTVGGRREAIPRLANVSLSNISIRIHSHSISDFNDASP